LTISESKEEAGFREKRRPGPGFGSGAKAAETKNRIWIRFFVGFASGWPPLRRKAPCIWPHVSIPYSEPEPGGPTPSPLRTSEFDVAGDAMIDPGIGTRSLNFGRIPVVSRSISNEPTGRRC